MLLLLDLLIFSTQLILLLLDPFFLSTQLILLLEDLLISEYKPSPLSSQLFITVESMLHYNICMNVFLHSSFKISS